MISILGSVIVNAATPNIYLSEAVQIFWKQVLVITNVALICNGWQIRVLELTAGYDLMVTTAQEICLVIVNVFDDSIDGTSSWLYSTTHEPLPLFIHDQEEKHDCPFQLPHLFLFFIINY